MNESMRVFALLGDASLRRQLQQQWRAGGPTLCGMHAEGGDSIVEELARVRPDVLLVDVDVDGGRQVVQAAAARLRLPVVALVRTESQGLAAVRPLEWGAASLVPREASSAAELAARIDAALTEVRDAQVVDVLESHFPLSGAFPDASVFDMRRSLQEMDPASKVIVLAAGVGGPMAVRRILHPLRTAAASPIVIAQRVHDALAGPIVQWLEHHTGAQVQRAVSCKLEPGSVHVAPTGCEVTIESRNGEVWLEVRASEAATTPGFDTLFESAAVACGARVVAAVLTGRGTDGSQGLLAVRRAGGFTMVQDRVSSLVYDAPAQARDGGGAIECLPINEIAERIQMLMRAEAARRVL
jgi:two-component system chemotaxis response regulator CheB